MCRLKCEPLDEMEEVSYNTSEFFPFHSQKLLKNSMPISSVIPISILVFLSLQYATPSSINPTSCRSKCGTTPIKFPFGSGPGCGSPNFTRQHIKCTSDNKLHLTTPSGLYTISSIDYTTNTAVITDPFMSTCSSMQNSGSFTLDPTCPFTLTPDNTFVLLGCSTTSPVFDKMAGFCDTGSGRGVCRGLYSCEGVSGIGLEPGGSGDTCCVYDPVGFGGAGLDLPKLQCSSYSVIHGFGGREGDPMKWEYGIMVRYDYGDTNACKNCEESGGYCGYSGLDEAFSCKCPNGLNTTVNCYGRGSMWSGTRRERIQRALTNGGLLLIWMLALL